jgi:hypothetical protein
MGNCNKERVVERLVLHPQPPACANQWAQRHLEAAWSDYAFSFAKAIAIDHPASYFVGKPESERAPIRQERLKRLAKFEAAYLKLLAGLKKSPNAKTVKKAKLAALPAPVQSTLFVDAWPGGFNVIASRFPRRPYVTDDLALGVAVRPLESATRYRYIQYNTPVFDHLLVIDYDCPDGVPLQKQWADKGLPTPAWFAETRGTGRGHAAIAIAAPVCTTNAARLKPLQYLARIEEGMRKAINGDKGFAGLLTKNPIHESAWQVTWGSPKGYTLDELAATVDIQRYTTFKNKKEVEIEAVGLGRKVLTFERARHWSYAAVSQYWGVGVEAWQEAVRARIDEINSSFAAPLQSSHCKSIAKSISRWVWKRFTPLTKHQLVLETHKPAVQALRGARKGAKRRDALMAEAKAMLDAGCTQTEVARQIGVSQKTVSNWRRRV